jgi:hypothetical protein
MERMVGHARVSAVAVVLVAGCHSFHHDVDV